MKLLETPQGTVLVRPATVEDAARLRQLRIEALANRPEAFAADYAAAVADPVEKWVDTLQKNASSNSGVICIACAGEQLVGMTGLGRGHWPKTRHSGVIWGVYVSPAWRGLRLADALLEECIAWGKDQGISIVKLGVVTTNTPAIRCYARCGFSVYGIEPQIIRYEGIDYDELLMARHI